MKKVLLLGILSLLFISCTSKTEYQTVKIKNRYSLDVPDFMSKGRNLHPDASLQYQNDFKEFYVMVFDEKKTEFPNPENMNLEEYTKLLRDNIESAPSDPILTKPRDTVINGLKAKLFSMTGQLEGVTIYYKMAYLESKDGLYQILTWTLENRKDQFSNDMDKMIASFRELGSKSRAK